MKFIYKKILAKTTDRDILSGKPQSVFEFVAERKYHQVQELPLSLIPEIKGSKFENMRASLLDLCDSLPIYENTMKEFIDSYKGGQVESRCIGSTESVIHEALDILSSVCTDINECISIFIKSDNPCEFINDHLTHTDLLRLISALKDLKPRIKSHLVGSSTTSAIFSDGFNNFLSLLRDRFRATYHKADSVVDRDAIQEYFERITTVLSLSTKLHIIVTNVIRNEQIFNSKHGT
jgi:hypothetical protein